jgi:3-deoxy-D-arabino-heptulosonate 7-phosphate (DAHP) synthase
MREVTIGKGFVLGRGRALPVIGGPCAIESERLCVEVASAVRDTCRLH